VAIFFFLLAFLGGILDIWIGIYSFRKVFFPNSFQEDFLGGIIPIKISLGKLLGV